MAIFNTEDYIQLMIQNAEPQQHRSKWTAQEDKIIVDCIMNGVSLSDIHRIISLRSLEAIKTKANSLGHGNRKNEDDGETYFSREINHKNRRTQDEIMEGKEFVSVPIESHNSMGKDIKVDVDIIPKKQIRVYIKDMFNISLPTNVFDCIYSYPNSSNYYGSINVVSKVVVSRVSNSDRQVTEAKNYICMGENNVNRRDI